MGCGSSKGGSVVATKRPSKLEAVVSLANEASMLKEHVVAVRAELKELMGLANGVDMTKEPDSVCKKCGHQPSQKTPLSPALSSMTASPTKHGQLPPLKSGLDNTERLLRTLPINNDSVVTGECARVTDGTIMLTDASPAQIGHACFKDPIVLLAGAPDIHLRFNYLMECGSGAYGISVGLVDASNSGWQESRVSSGTLTYTGLNYTGRPGALSGVGLDTSGKFAAKGSIGKQRGTVVLQGGEASGFETIAQAKHPVMTKGGFWKQVDVIWRISVGHVKVSVSIDGNDVLKETRAEGLVFPRKLGIVFGASATNTRHSVKDVQISGGGTVKSLDPKVSASFTDLVVEPKKLELEDPNRRESSPGPDMPSLRQIDQGSFSLREIDQGSITLDGSKQRPAEESTGETVSSEREPESGQDRIKDDAKAKHADQDGPSKHETQEGDPESQEGAPRQEATDPEMVGTQDEALDATEASKDSLHTFECADGSPENAGTHEVEAVEADELVALDTERGAEDVLVDEQRAAADPEEAAPLTPRKEESYELPPETYKTPYPPADIA